MHVRWEVGVPLDRTIVECKTSLEKLRGSWTRCKSRFLEKRDREMCVEIVQEIFVKRNQDYSQEDGGDSPGRENQVNSKDGDGEKEKPMEAGKKSSPWAIILFVYRRR